MPRLNSNAAMLWGMAALITGSLVFLRELQAAGLHPVHAALFQAIGCTVSIALVDRRALRCLPRRRDGLAYFIVASLLGFTVPRLVVSATVSHTGVGLTTLAFTLPLVVTYAIAITARLEAFDRQQFSFLVVTLLGALVYVGTRVDAVTADAGWIALLLIAPISLGLGNIYRTTAWPQNMRPTTAALATSVCSLVTYSAIAGIAPVHTPLAFFGDAGNLGLLLVFMAMAGVGQMLLFHLQHAAGPVYIGQAGALVVLLGGVTGYVLFDEHYTALTFLGSVLIVLGVTRYCGVRAAEARA